MLNTQIIASQVSNLTDARYYAAWGVPYMSFTRSKGDNSFISREALFEIREWVEGPRFLGEFSGMEGGETIENIIDQEKLSGAILGPFVSEEIVKSIDVEIMVKECLFSNMPEELPSLSIVKLKKSDIKELNITSDQFCYLDIYDVDLDTIKRVIQEQKYGLVLRGGEEEKVGFKSFGFLDDVYDLLME